MLRKWFCFLVLVGFCCGELNFETLERRILEKNPAAECASQYLSLDTASKAKLLNSFGRPIPVGLTAGNFYDLGAYDNCLSIQNEEKKIYGKYCLASPKKKSKTDKTNGLLEHNLSQELIQTMEQKFNNSPLFGELEAPISPEDLIHFGICIPDKCTSDFIQQYVDVVFSEANCYTKLTNQQMETSALITMLIIYVFILVAVASTVYDLFINYHSTRPKHQILIAFSMFTNGKKIIKYTKDSNQLECLAGMKSISMMWVILGHTYLNMLSSATIDNAFSIPDWMDAPENMLILAATLSVDTFFTIGGLLTVYTYMRSPPMETKQSYKQIPLLYLHRYLRLTPAFAMLVLIYGSGLVKYISDGPKWSMINGPAQLCTDNWWAALLYFQNYIGYKDLCITQTWYLALDFQLFLITPFILIPLRKWPRKVICCLYALAVAGMVYPFYLGFADKLNGIGQGLMNEEYIQDFYFVTHARFSPYVIGMISGFYIHSLKSRPRPFTPNMGIILLLWTVSIAVGLFCIFDGYHLVKHGDDQWADGFYMAFNRPVWSLAVTVVILLCSTGNGGPINKFLSLSVFQILSKLSYTMYLTHYIIILIVNLSSRTPIHFTNFTTICQFFVIFVITLFVSIFYCLIFESPMITIERLIFPRRRRDNRENEEKI